MRLSINLLIAIIVAAGILAVAVIDHLTGMQIQVFPLYFLPLILAAWQFSYRTAIATAVFIAAVWAGVQYGNGRTFPQAVIWVINFLVQAGTFTILALLVGMLRDALHRERDLSRTDPLTGLANSRSFFERAGSVLAMCHRNMQPATLAYIDLDNFKKANDTLGHTKGDAMLRIVTRVLTENLRASDVAARMGGDEFVVLLPDTTRETASRALEKVRVKLAQTDDFHASGVTVSIGAVTWASAPSDITPMIKAADKLMYRVKETSKNRVIVQEFDQFVQTECAREIGQDRQKTAGLHLPEERPVATRTEPRLH